MSLTTTFQLRLPRGEHEDVLADMAACFGDVERQLHVALNRAHAEVAAEVANNPKALEVQFDEEGKKLPGPLARRKNAIKVSFLSRFQITGRQYNSILTGLEGRHDSLRELAKSRLERHEHDLKKLERKINARDKKLASFAKVAAAVDERAKAGKGPTKAQAKKLLTRREYDEQRFVQHQQKRRAGVLKDRIAQVRAELDRPIPPVVFGSKELLKARARIHPNDRVALAAWRKRWDRARAGGFLVMGSKDESAGCQSCNAEITPDGRLNLKLRLPNQLATEKTNKLELVELTLPEFGREEITAAIMAHKVKDPARRAISYRFVRDADWPDRKELSAWRVCITIDVPTPDVSTKSFETYVTQRGDPTCSAVAATEDFIGAIGVDLNADHIAWAMIDRSGNPVLGRNGRIELPLRGKSAGHRRTLIGGAARDLVAIAADLGLPLVVERLDFKNKKREMKDKGAGYARMLSSFAYSAIQEAIRRHARKGGIELVDVNPAYTSLIGKVNFAKRYGLSVHVSAAVAIARRAACFSERINYIHGYRGRRNTLPTASESRRHVWRQWALVRKDEQIAMKRASGSRPAAGAATSAPSSTPRGAKGGRETLGLPKDQLVAVTS